MTAATPPGPPESRDRAIGWSQLIAVAGTAWLVGLGLATFLNCDLRSTLPAILEARTTSVIAARPCSLAEILVQSGQRVSAGDPILRFTDERLEARVAAKERQLVELRADHQRAIAAAEVELAWRRRELRSDVFQTQLNITRLTQERLSRQVEQLAWREQISGDTPWKTASTTDDIVVRPIILSHDRPDSSRIDAMLKEDAAATATVAISEQIQLCEKRLGELNQLSEQMDRAVRTSAGVDVAQARVDRAEAELQQLQDQQRELRVKSPGPGTVGIWRKQVGDVILSGETVVALLDDADRFLTVDVSAAQLAKLPAGQVVVIEFGKDQREGVVAAIPPETVRESRTAVKSESALRLRIDPRGKLWPSAPIGSEARVVLP